MQLSPHGLLFMHVLQHEPELESQPPPLPPPPSSQLIAANPAIAAQTITSRFVIPRR
jgi:hypothetical protein